MNKQIDVVIVGAGISGIGLAVHLLKQCPDFSFEIFESRSTFGGTWDLFKYPGIRSDSDMMTFGYSFKPWNKPNTLADAASIKQYLNEVITDYDLDSKINYRHKVKSANYLKNIKKWSVEIEDENQQIIKLFANFFVACTGYYDYKSGYFPDFTNIQQFSGELIHPQHWPENLNYVDKKIVVIGSGATAITLVPALVKGGASHVTMLQRSPTYIASIPSKDMLYIRLRKYFSDELAYKIIRSKNILLQQLLYLFAQKQPNWLRKILINSIKKQLDNNVSIEHFSPDYNPWEQRLCAVPDGDLFTVLNSDQAEIITGKIETFTEKGILLKNNQTLDADIVVSATGLNIQILGGIELSIDDQPLHLKNHMLYKGVLLSDVPNMAIMMGYINASWTLKVDIASEYLCNLMRYMKNNNLSEVIPLGESDQKLSDTVMGKLNSGYINRAANILPKQGKSMPWYVSNNYFYDRKILKKCCFKDGILQFKE